MAGVTGHLCVLELWALGVVGGAEDRLEPGARRQDLAVERRAARVVASDRHAPTLAQRRLQRQQPRLGAGGVVELDLVDEELSLDEVRVPALLNPQPASHGRGRVIFMRPCMSSMEGHIGA